MNQGILGLFFCFLLFASYSANAVLVACHGCSESQMKMNAEETATRLPAGTYDIKVLNITDADYHLYQIRVVRHSNTNLDANAEVQLQTTRLTVADEADIKSQIRRLRSAIENIKTLGSGENFIP